MKITGKAGAILVAALLLFAGLNNRVTAQPQQSANFRITKSVLDAGGATASSTNFRLVSAFGQPSPVGQQSSTSFRLSGGFLSPVVIGSLNAISSLVIHSSGTDAILDWGRHPEATTYNIYRGTVVSFVPGPATLIGSTSDTTYTDINIISSPATTYFYDVTASASNALPPALASVPKAGNAMKTPVAVKRQSAALPVEISKKEKSPAKKPR